MKKARKEKYPDNDMTIAEWCKALSHPARVAILRNLANRGECICGELVIDLPLAQSTVSQHLKALKMAGLIQGEIDGPRSKYCINKKNFERFTKIMDEFNEKLNNKLSGLNCSPKGGKK